MAWCAHRSKVPFGHLRQLPRQISTRPKVGVIVDCTDTFGRAILRGVTRYANLQRRWHLYKDIAHALDAYKEWGNLDGGIFAGVPATSIPEQRKHCKHIVYCSGSGDPRSSPVVALDDRAAGAQAAEHLIDCGLDSRPTRGFRMGGMEPRDAGARDGAVQSTADGLIPIERFARLSGLSIGALRHYDELDLLRPADVDRFTGYRRYRPEQLEVARTIGRLRDLEVPIEEIRQVLGADDPGDQRRRIGVHERRLQARVDRLVHLLHVTRQLSQGKESLMTSTGTAGASETLDAETHRQLGKDLYNRTWALIEATDRTPETDDEMVFSAHASAYHWSKSGGTLANAARSHWQILWLLMQGHSTAEVAAVTGYSPTWMYAIVHRYNQQGPEALGDRRQHNPGKLPLLSASQRAELEQALAAPAPDGGLWTGPKVARWMSDKLGRTVHPARGWELLHLLGYRSYVPRPRHAKADAAAQEQFKKNAS